MAKSSSFLLAVSLLLCISHRGGAAKCSLSDIMVELRETGRAVEGAREYEVKVSNKCKCAQAQVTLRCLGLSSVEPVDPSLIKTVDDRNCLVADGRPLVKGSPVTFKYAWMTPQDFPVVGTRVQC